MGLVISLMFNNPFLNDFSQKKLILSSLESTAYTLIAPIVCSFMIGLIGELKKGQYNGVILAARDGYIVYDDR